VKYAELKKLSSEKLTESYNKCKVFWAFSNEQFDENLKKEGIDKNERITSIGMGGYLPSKNVKKYIKLMEEHSDWFKTEIKKVNKEEVILYELRNFECYYTGDITDALQVLESYGFTKAEVVEVFLKKGKKCR